MSILFKLTKKHLRLNRKRTLLTITGIMISMAMVTAIAGFFISFQDLSKREAIKNNGDWHVAFINVNEEQIASLKENKLFTSPRVGVSKEYIYQEGKEDPIVSIQPKIELKMTELDRSLYAKAESIKKDLGISKVIFNTDLLFAEGIVENDNYNNGLFKIIAIMIGMIVIGSVIVISNSFYTSASERGREFGLLKSVGATKKQIQKTVILEGVILSVIAIPAGFILGMLVEAIALTLANYLLGKAGFSVSEFHVKTSGLAIFISMVISFITVMISTLLPAYQSSKIAAIDLIRQTRVFKIRKKDVKVPWYIKKFFGVEGVLAAKSLRRNRGKYRATIISLVVSIILFIGGSSFIDISNNSSEVLYSSNGLNVRVMVTDKLFEVYDQVIDDLGKIEYSEQYEVSKLSFTAPLSKSTFTSKGKEIVEPSMYTTEANQHVIDTNIIAVSDAEFQRIAKENNIEMSKVGQESKYGGILINSTGTIDYNQKKVKISPFTLKTGDKIELISETKNRETSVIHLDGVIDEVPKNMALNFSPYSVNILVSKQVYKELSKETAYRSLVLYVKAQNATSYVKKAEEVIEENAKSVAGFVSENSTFYFITNFEKMAEQQRNFMILVMLFVYGFVAMLTLIGVTSVISTISTTMALRKREFAILRSIGMSEKSMSRMFHLESLLYGLRAILIGIPLALILSYSTYKAQFNAIETAYKIPWLSMLISIVAIFILTFATMHFAKKKQRKENMIDVLTQSNI